MHTHQKIEYHVEGSGPLKTKPTTDHKVVEWPSLPIQEASAREAWAAEAVCLEGCTWEARTGEGGQREA